MALSAKRGVTEASACRLFVYNRYRMRTRYAPLSDTDDHTVFPIDTNHEEANAKMWPKEIHYARRVRRTMEFVDKSRPSFQILSKTLLISNKTAPVEYFL